MWRLLVVLVPWCATSWASTFVITAGVEQYDDARVSSLRFANADARSLAAVFRSAGLPASQLVCMTSDDADAAQRPTRINLITVLQRVRDLATEDDSLVWFFAGHGVEREGETFLLTMDTRADLIEATGLPMALVRQALAGLKARDAVFLVDSCRTSHLAARGDQGAQLTGGLVRGFTGFNVDPRPGSAIKTFIATYFACSPGEQARENPSAGHGRFTTWLLAGLQGGAVNEEGEVTLRSLERFVGFQAAGQAAGSATRQTPMLVTSAKRDMALLRPPKEALVTVNFRDTPLADVVVELADKMGVGVVLGQGADPQSRVTARLDREPVSSALTTLVTAHGLAVRRQGGIYVIEAPGASPVTTVNLPRRVSAHDGMEQVLVPAGEFLMGSTDVESAQALTWLGKLAPQTTPAAFADEQPARRVKVDAFWMDVHEVTVAQYCLFLNAIRPSDTQRRSWVTLREEHPQDWLSVPPLDRAGDRYVAVSGRASEPITWVSWAGAAAYADWVRRALPSEAQWERAARGAENARHFVWGDSAEPPVGAGNLIDRSAAQRFGWPVPYPAYSDGYPTLAPVKSFRPNSFGLYDMAGNVFQWCLDWYEARFYEAMPTDNPVAKQPTEWRSLRGGSWTRDERLHRVATRTRCEPAAQYNFNGFRCVAQP